MRIGCVLAGGVSTNQIVPPVLASGGVPGAALYVVAADGGLDLAERLGLAPDLVVGDLDSVSAPALARARDAGIEIREHPVAKDETDLELALTAVMEAGAERVIVLGGGGGRLDHLLGNVAALVAAARSAPVEAWMGSEYLVVVRDTWSARLPPGATVSVLAWDGAAVVSEAGVRWPLDHRRVDPGSTLGISNEALGGPVEITVHDGTAVVVVPDAKDLS